MTVAVDAILRALAPLPGVTIDQAVRGRLRVRLNDEVLLTVNTELQMLSMPTPRDVLPDLLRAYPGATGRRGVLTLPLTDDSATKAAALVLHRLRVQFFSGQYLEAGP